MLDYKGTVIFTSHDRHFMKRVATCIIEVRDGRVANYRGDYEAYLYSVNKEIDEGEREREAAHARRPQAGPRHRQAAKSRSRQRRRATSAHVRKEIATSRADDRPARRSKSGRSTTNCSTTTDPAEALRLHNEVAAVTAQLAEAEDRWCQLQEEVAAE